MSECMYICMHLWMSSNDVCLLAGTHLISFRLNFPPYIVIRIYTIAISLETLNEEVNGCSFGMNRFIECALKPHDCICMATWLHVSDWMTRGVHEEISPFSHSVMLVSVDIHLCRAGSLPILQQMIKTAANSRARSRNGRPKNRSYRQKIARKATQSLSRAHSKSYDFADAMLTPYVFT